MEQQEPDLEGDDSSTEDESSVAGEMEEVVAEYESGEEVEERGLVSVDPEPQEGRQPGQVFDPVLISRHTYLGTRWEELQGRTILDENEIYEIPLLLHASVVGIPGHTVPLTIFHQPTISMLRRVVQGNHLFGIISISYEGQGAAASSTRFGTTAEIFEYSEEEETTPGMKIKVKGRQRFRLLEQRRQVDGNLMGKVKILPDKNLPDSLYEIRLTSLDRYRVPCDKKDQLYKKQYKVPVSSWPAWVHTQYDAHLLAHRVTSEMRFSDARIKLPSDPEELSYWLTQNLPLEDQDRLLLLSKDSTVQRLRCALGLLEHCKVLSCRECGHSVARQSDVFCMTQEGSQSAFVNPAGFVHDTLTLTKAKGVKVVTRPSTQFSWFPGYAWSVADCVHCENHIGWLFTATADNQQPLRFWGLTRRSLKPRLRMGDQGSNLVIVM